ncbi:MAG: hypothetical protein ACLQBB_14365 [Solirubrobacteraceae bacterium]
MSEPGAQTEPGGWGWLPARLRPRSRELPGTGNLRAVETTLLVLAGLALAIATINDVARQTGINQRLIADLRTWRSYTGHDYHNLSADQELLGITSHRDVVCGNTSPGVPKATVQVCLVVTGSTVDGRRHVSGGWYLPAHTEDDVRELRYGCFGPAASGLCR